MGISAGNVFVLHVCRGQWSVSDVYTKMQSCPVIDAMPYSQERYENKIDCEQRSGSKESVENAVKMLAGYRVEVVHSEPIEEGRAGVSVGRDAWQLHYLDFLLPILPFEKSVKLTVNY